MNVPVICASCGSTLRIPSDYARSKMQCPACGVYCAIPANAQREPAAAPPPRAAAESVPSKAAPQPAPAPGTPLLQGTDEDDGRPYTVPGDPVDPASLAPKPAPRPLGPLMETWESGWSLRARVQVFIALQALNVLVLLLAAVYSGNVLAGAVPVLVGTALLAFLVGTFDRITLSRNPKGRVRLTRTWRVAFFDMPGQVIPWSEHETVAATRSYKVHLEDWAVFFVLLGYGLIPAVVWWWYVIRPVRFQTILYKDHGFPETVIFRTQQEWLADEVADTVAEVTGLPIKQEWEESSGGRMIGR